MFSSRRGNWSTFFRRGAASWWWGWGEIFFFFLGGMVFSLASTPGAAAVVAVQLVEPATTKWPWWGAILAALLVCAIIGALQGTLITRLRLSSLIVTLAGSLILNGVMLIALGLGPFSGSPSLQGTNPNVRTLYKLMWGTIDPVVSWIGMVLVVIVIGSILWWSDSRRRQSGLAAPPASLTVLKIALIAVVGIVVVAICNVNRAAIGTLAGVPWVIPIVLVIMAVWMVLTQRTRFGSYVYAIGVNPEAARQAGVNLAIIRTWCFVLCSFTSGIGGLLYASYLGGVSNNFNGGQIVLYAIAAAGIGGTSLFCGRGQKLHGVLRGLVIGGLYKRRDLLAHHRPR